MTIIIGIDPGLVHTGLVVMDIETDVVVTPFVIEGTMSHAIQVADELGPLRLGDYHMFVEAYRPRGNSFSTDPKMRDLMADFRHVFPKAKVIDNTGMKHVVTRELMERLGVWKFNTPTHHQDLRSAARIGIYGALKDEDLNRVLYDYVTKESA